MKRSYLSKLVVLLALLAGWNVSSFAQTTTYIYTGGEQSYVVPPGVTQLGIDAIGGAGGYPYWQCGNSVQYGLGGRVQCTLNVTPGTTLWIYVGGAGGSEVCNSCAGQTGGFNGGYGGAGCAGGSGGATDIRLVQATTVVPNANGTATPYTSTNRIVVAGGGGGGADYYGFGGVGGGTVGGTGTVGSCGGTGGTGGTQVGGGVNGNAGSLGVGGHYVNQGNGGGGYWGGGSGSGTCGGGGGGSSYTDPVLVTSFIHTQGYTGATGNGSLKITVLCTTPGTVVPASASVCPGATISLTNPTATGGTWVSGNLAVATVNPLTGVVTSVSAGTAIISYSESNPCGGVIATATATVTVNPFPPAIGGITNVCTGFSTTLSDASAGGTWTASNTNVSIAAGTGVVTGVIAGSSTITYTLPTGCSTTTGFTINSQPAAITGIMNTCPGLTTALGDLSPSGTWTSSSTTTATVGAGSGVVTGIAAGTTNISYTLGTGCFSTATVTVNPAPASIGGINNVCVGYTTTLTDATPGGTWTSSNPTLASVGLASGVVSGFATGGSPTITYTLGITGCRATIPIVVNPLPGPITGSGNVCVGATTTLSSTGIGSWSSGSTSTATVGAGSGVVTGVTPGTTVITYTLITGCNISIPMIVNPVPTAYTVTGGGNYCAGGTGVNVGLSYSNSGVNYQLYVGGVAVPGALIAGSNSGIDFGLQTGAGVYTVKANNPLTTCNNIMTGSVTVVINPLPNLRNVTGGGDYCAGGTGKPIGLDVSDVGIKYQVYNGTTPVGGLVAGTGFPLNLGLFTAPGTYTVMAINSTTGCSDWMSGSQTITVDPLPTAYTLMATNGGYYCAGGIGVQIILLNSDPGNMYQLFRGGTPLGAPVISVGGPINFGYYTAGVYSVVGTDGFTFCTNTMGSVTIATNPLPVVYLVTGGGGYCAGGAGVHIGLNFSSTGINYQLTNGAPVDTVSGSGSGLDFGLQTVGGTYTVVAYNTVTGCSSNMSGSATITINPLPFIHTVTGGGNYCSGATGVHIGLDLADAGINYKLYRGITPVSAALGGAGYALDFGLYTTTGTYSVVATNAATGCISNMSGTATVGVNPLPPLHTVTGGGNYCLGGAGVHVMLDGSNTGIKYELLLGGGSIGVIFYGTGSAIDFGMQTGAGNYTVVATDTSTLCAKNMSGSVIITINPLPTVFNVTGGGNYCSGGAGRHIGLSGSSSGISYQLYNNWVASGSPLSGSGGVLDYGLKTGAGNYSVIATNVITSCTDTMNNVATIIINPLPANHAISPGANYCAGGLGVDVYLSGSDIGINYQLFRSGTAIADSTGTGSIIDFGLQTIAGAYSIVATDAFTGCNKNMPGSAIINIISPTAYTVTGGGNYCLGDPGVHVGLSGSALGVNYKLYIGGVLTGITLPGTGTSLDFGLDTAGIYTVTATDTTYGCVSAMTGSVTVGINPLPVLHNVTGTGNYCAGGTGLHVGLDNSNTGINYQLYRGISATGGAISGTGSMLDLGLETIAGTYTVKATDAVTGCSSIMTGTAVITIKPLPVAYIVNITGENPSFPGYFCATDPGVHIFLPGSDTGVKYQLWRGGIMVGSAIAGTGLPLDMGLQIVAGTYTITAADTTAGGGCTNNMSGNVTVHIVPLPIVHNVTGGGGYCPGGSGVHVGLDASDPGIYYRLFRTGSIHYTTLFGTGVALDFGLKDTVDTYTVIGITDSLDPVTHTIITLACPNNMYGSATVFVDTILTPNVSIRAYPGTGVGVWHIDSMHVSVTNGGTNPTYQWVINGHIIAGATNASFTHQEFFNNDSVACLVTASGPCGGYTTVKSLIIRLSSSGVNTIGATGSDIKLIPNPNKGVFVLKGSTGSTTDEEVSLEVTNVLGQVVYSAKVMTQNGNIDKQIQLGSNLANGMYILNLRSGTLNNVFHFVVEQ